MDRLFALYRFNVTSDYRFRLRGRNYVLGRGGVRALKLLRTFAESSSPRGDVAWLLPFRDQIREVERTNPSAALTHIIDRTDNPRLRCFAIWLRGRCGGKLGTAAVSRFSNAPDRVLRKEVTRCLKRLSGWAVLRVIAETDPDPQIRQLARQSPSKPYPGRLTVFSRHLSLRQIGPSVQKLVVSPEMKVTHERSLKPPWWIRMLLDRIHRLVTESKR